MPKGRPAEIVAAEVLAAGVVRHPLHPSGGSRPSRRADEYTLGQGLPRAHPDPHARPSTRLRITLTHASLPRVDPDRPWLLELRFCPAGGSPKRPSRGG